jgi:hypothetical protein
MDEVIVLLLKEKMKKKKKVFIGVGKALFLESLDIKKNWKFFTQG